MRIVAVGFKKMRGKDTFCNFALNHLQIHCNCKVKKEGFADKLKDIAYQLYGWSGLQRGVYYEEHYEEKEEILPAIGMSPRDIWIKVGNTLRDVYNPTWIHFITKGIHNVDILLIKDLGFINEALEVRKSGGILLKIERNGPMANDARETELDTWTDWDAIINNHGTLLELHTQAVQICEELILK
jgi:hypothetical protein